MNYEKSVCIKPMCLMLVVSILLSGCSTSHRVTSSSEPQAISYDDVNKELRGREVDILLMNDERKTGKDIIIETDSTSWIDTKTGVQVKVGTNEIQMIMEKNHFLGALEGLGFGVVGCGVLGAIIDAPSSASSPSRDITVPAGILVGTLVGMLVGPITGSIIGHSYEYNFASDTTANKQLPKEEK